MTDHTGLVLDRLNVALKDQQIVAIDAKVGPGQVLTVMGPSGSGKSTLLAALTGTLDPVFRMSGRILLDGRDVTGLKTQERGVGILLQEHLLFPHLSVGGNLAFGLSRSIKSKAERVARIDEALVEVGLAGYADRDPATLSGGQKARVALMRTLLAEPCALLLDEPFSKLDTQLRGQVRELVFSSAQRRGLPVVLVTHDQSDADQAGGQLVRLG